MPQITEGCLQIRGWHVESYALLDQAGHGVTLIDGGFIGGIDQIEAELALAGRSLEDVRAILLTHGHIDHTLNLAKLRERTGASVFAPGLDEDHIAGRFPYRGVSRICGMLEKAARTLFHFRPPEVDHWFADGDQLDSCGGLEVIHLPGHTPGHCGFYSRSRQLLFAGDLFTNYFHLARKPPRIFNVDHRQVSESIRRADALDLSGGVILNHAFAGASPGNNREDLRKLANR